jgi:hypothetical protein
MKDPFSGLLSPGPGDVSALAQLLVEDDVSSVRGMITTNDNTMDRVSRG